MSEARDRWLAEGIHALAEEGSSGVRIDRLAARLGLSKGSFHHHFRGAAGYKTDLLAHVEQLSVSVLNSAIADAEASGGARAVLQRLTELVGPRGEGLYHPELEVAVRAWSISDPEVREVQARIDQARLLALQQVWRPYVESDEDARRAALLPYLLAVGASVLSPPVAATELQSVFELLLPLVPDEPADAP